MTTATLSARGKSGLTASQIETHSQVRRASDFLAMTRRIVAAAGRRIAEADAADLAQLIEIRRTLDHAIGEAVRGLRSGGATWEEIGAVTGVTRQAALMFFNPRLAAADLSAAADQVADP